MSSTSMKINPDSENEVHDAKDFADEGSCRVTPVASFSPAVAQSVVETLMQIVRKSHDSEITKTADGDGIIRAQAFEEGDVYMLESPFENYPADRYLMDFYDVEERDICSRMHLHTGLRFVRIMTGPGTQVRISSLAPIEITHIEGITPFFPQAFQDEKEAVLGEGVRYNVMAPENSWIDIQIPRGVSHQFNAIGPLAVIDSVHPEESIETFRENMSGFRMMAQTIFLADERPSSESCVSIPAG